MSCILLYFYPESALHQVVRHLEAFAGANREGKDKKVNPSFQTHTDSHEQARAKDLLGTVPAHP